jgi:hypothetical protein
MTTEELQDLNLSASGRFERSLIEDKTPPAPDADSSIVRAYGPDLDRFLVLPYYRNAEKYGIDSAPQYGDVTEIKLQPWRGPLKHRLAAQAEDIRKRLSNPAAIVLAVRGTNYSAENIDDVLKLYFAAHPKTKALVRTQKSGLWVRIKNGFKAIKSLIA